MPRIRVLATSTVVMAVMAVSAIALPSTSVAQPDAARAMLKRINVFRHAHGLRSLHMSRSLRHSAYRFSRQLMRDDRFSHASHIEASRRFKRLGEVLALHRGRAPAVNATLRAWANSPEHRAILLSNQFTSIGLGRTYGRFQGQRANIWVGQLGHR
jgi:uncharacterized protein YkwD